MNSSDPNEIKYGEQMAMGKKPLSETLSPQEFTKLDSILRKKVKITAKQVEPYSMIAIMGLLSARSFGCKDMKQYETVFIEMAVKKNIGIVSLETYKSQIESFENAYGNDELLDLFEATTKEETTQWIGHYKNEDIDALYKSTTHETQMNAKAKKYMLDERNINWVKTLPEMMKKESLFIAVGASHLAGDSGLINLLKKAGYKVKPVTK